MPEKKELPKTPIKIPKDIADKLRAQAPEIESARHGLAVLKKLGLDTKEVEDKLTWAEEVRTTLLKEFT